MDIGIITNPTLPPIVGYVEVEVDGVRQYQQVENSQNSVISDLQQQNTLLTDTLDNLMTSILPELMGK